MEDGNAIQESPKCIKTLVTFESQCNGCDYISPLPDEVLGLILDKLPMEDAWPTCILAKRWKNLWRYMTDVVFDGNWVQRTGKNVFWAAEHFMHCHQGQKIQRLSVSLRYNSYMRDSVNNWIMYAFEKNVEEICIDLNGIEKKPKWRKHSDFCLLPDCEIEYSMLAKLTLKFMKLQMLPTCLTALKELYLEEVELAADALEKITSICSSLTLLSLSNCNINSDLKIKISVNCSLLKLIINEEIRKRKNKKLYLHAPSITTIEFASALPRKRYILDDLPMVDQVKFSLDKMSRDPLAVLVLPTESLFGRDYYINFFKLFNVFESANAMFLSSWCVQILALENTCTPFRYGFEGSHLVLEMGLSKRDLGGLVYMLNICDALKRLSIVITKAVEFTFQVSQFSQYFHSTKGFASPYYRIAETEDLPTLEVVEFKNNCANFDRDLRANGSFCFDEARFLEGTECGLVALSLLKSKAKNLRNLVFESRKCRCETDLQNGTYSYSRK